MKKVLQFRVLPVILKALYLPLTNESPFSLSVRGLYLIRGTSGLLPSYVKENHLFRIYAR